MSLIAKQSTAITVTVGPILDADGVAVTGAAVSALKISKNGGAPAVLNGSATLTHRHTGHYSLALTASDVDTVGTAEIVIDSTTNAMPIKPLQVVEEAIYDALFAASATGLLPANVTQISGDTQSATDLKDFADSGYDPATNKVQGVVLVDTATTLTNLPAITTDWLTAAGLTAAAANKIADHTRRRTQANVEASSDGDTLALGSLYGLIQQAQESNAVDTPGSLTVYQTDGTTPLGTKALDSDAAADPVVGIS